MWVHILGGLRLWTVGDGFGAGSPHSMCRDSKTRKLRRKGAKVGSKCLLGIGMDQVWAAKSRLSSLRS